MFSLQATRDRAQPKPTGDAFRYHAAGVASFQLMFANPIRLERAGSVKPGCSGRKWQHPFQALAGIQVAVPTRSVGIVPLLMTYSMVDCTQTAIHPG
jgi:hypothetical protein